MIKSTTKPTEKQHLAGILPDDSGIEFYGLREFKKVLWVQNGKTRFFHELPKTHFNLLKSAYLADAEAVADLQCLGNLERQVELYTYFLYGDMDSTPDIQNNTLAPSENFRHTTQCISLGWSSKNITIDGAVLTPREIVILDGIKDDLPDKAIANILGIAHSTYDIHKRNLLHKTNCQTKVALAIKAGQQKVFAS